ncbi:MAG TPA: patatin-like phospholipase family protein, partial [Burkholderiales bacterium]|nr:patatin-like phospholipase family protein [Burkholderiales bacterium]
LLEEPKLKIEAISGTSAGAINAATLASGYVKGGREGARKSLDDFWNSMGTASYSIGSSTGVHRALLPNPQKLLLGLTRFFSPYQLNPFDINPLRDMVAKVVDFDAVQSRRAIRLFVGATRVRTGTLRLFENRELTSDALLASACLPTLHHAIEIDGEPYWDGGYSGNPAVYPLIYRCKTPSILVVMLQPLTREDPPTTAQAIRSRLTEFQFNSSFLREMRSIALAKQAIDAQWLPIGRLERRFRKLNFHLIETDDLLARMSIEKALNADLAFLLKLKEEGRIRAGAWLENHFDQVGGESSVDLAKLFG